MTVRRFYRGWTMVGLSLLAITLVMGSTLFVFGLFVDPVSRDLGLSRATMNSGMICIHIGMALLSPIVGRVLDRSSPRLMVGCGGVALGVGWVLLGIGDALWPKVALLAIALPFAMSGAGPLGCYVLLARWFRVHRGRAMAIAAFGQALGSVLVSPLIALLIEHYGWRTAMMIWGPIVGLAILLISRLLQDEPGEGDHEPGADRAEEALQAAAAAHAGPLGYGKILSQPVFWILALVIGISLAITQAILVSLVPLATGRGYSLMQATSAMSALGLSSVAGMALLTVIADRFDRATLLAICILVLLLFTLSLSVDTGFMGLILSCLLCGAATGMIFPAYSALLADRFGAGSLGTVEGIVAPVIAGMAAVLLRYTGASFDQTGGYTAAMLSFSIASGVALALLSLLWFNRKRPERAGAGA